MLVRDKTNSLQVELLCVHVYLELVLGRKSLASRHDLECCKDVVLLGITFMFPFHLVFALVARKFVCFVPLEVLVQAIFDACLEDPEYTKWLDPDPEVGAYRKFD